MGSSGRRIKVSLKEPVAPSCRRNADHLALMEVMMLTVLFSGSSVEAVGNGA